MGTPSKKQIEANRLNALKSTGPKTEQGKQRSRCNGLRHGLAAEVIVPEADRTAFDAALARWERDAGPANVVEEHLIRRAAVGSVQLERIEQAREQTRLEAAAEAVELWTRRQQARARKLGQSLPHDPSNTVDDLESTAFGCDWMIRQWQTLEASLHLGRGWDQRQLGKAQNLLGLPEGTPGPMARPLVRSLWILAAAAMPGKVAAIPRHPSEAELPANPEAAIPALGRFIAEQIRRLQALRDESWEVVEGPRRDAVARLAASSDTSKEGQLRHRYEVAADRSTNAAIRQYLNLRDRRRREVLEIAKEARHCDTPRAPVGGGWWCEVDCDPAPPGFARIDPIPPAADLDEPVPIDSTPSPEPSPEPTGDRPEPTRPHPGTAGAPLRSEANSTPDSSAGVFPKSFCQWMIRDGDSPIPSGPDRRTEARPNPADRLPDGDRNPDRTPKGSGPTPSNTPPEPSEPPKAG